MEIVEKKPIEFGKVTNPTLEDLEFKYDSAPYVLKAGQTETRWSPHMSKHAAKRLADKNIMTSNPEEHRTLMGAYLENSDVEVIAKRLGVDLTKIRKEAMTKEKSKARVINLEAQMLEMQKKIDALTPKKEEIKVEEPKEEVKAEEPKEEILEVEEPIKKVEKKSKKK